MTKQFRIVKSEDATMLVIEGDKRNPEPISAIIKFPGGHVEVTRTTTGDYWCHFQRTLDSNTETGDRAGSIVDSRIDYTPEAWRANGCAIPPIPAHADIQHIAVRVEAVRA